MNVVASPSKLGSFPISLFAMTMGLAGLAICSHRVVAAPLLAWPLSFLALVVFLIYAGAYGLKVIRHLDVVQSEWSCSFRINFFCAIPISLLLLASAFLTINMTFSSVLWHFGTVGQFILSLATLNYWLSQSHFEVKDTPPAWFIPVVGNIIVPVAGFSHAPAELLWFFFAWGLLFYGILLVVITFRLIFYPALPDQMQPTLFIFLAPPSIGFVSYMNMTGELDLMARLLFYWAVFFFIILVSRIRNFLKLDFALSWWAYSFPMTAFTTANSIMAEQTGLAFFDLAAKILFVLTFAIISFLFVRTMIAFKKGHILKPA